MSVDRVVHTVHIDPIGDAAPLVMFVDKPVDQSWTAAKTKGVTP
jgi:hypothetical protein